jgi:hypothetical protein
MDGDMLFSLCSAFVSLTGILSGDKARNIDKSNEMYSDVYRNSLVKRAFRMQKSD